MRKEILRYHSTLPSSIQVLPLQQTRKPRAWQRRREEKSVALMLSALKGLLTIVSSPETFISNSYSTCLQRLKSLAGTLPPLERRQGSGPQIFASQLREGASRTSDLLCGSLWELVLHPRSTPDSRLQVLMDDNKTESEIIRILQADWDRGLTLTHLLSGVRRERRLKKYHLLPPSSIVLCPQCHRTQHMTITST